MYQTFYKFVAKQVLRSSKNNFPRSNKVVLVPKLFVYFGHVAILKGDYVSFRNKIRGLAKLEDFWLW